MIGIIGAMDEEVEKIKAQMQDVKITEKAQMEFFEGTLSGKPAVVVRSGIGKVNAGICAQILSDTFGVDGIINTGIAGSLRNEINIGDVVISTDAVQHDMDVEAFGYPRGQVPRMDVLAFPADERMVSIAEEACKKAVPEIGTFKGRVASGDMFVADKTVKENIVKEFDAYCCEMEGAAIAQAAYLNRVPYVILRAISDKADDSAQMDYPTFEKKAIEHSVAIVQEMVVRF